MDRRLRGGLPQAVTDSTTWPSFLNTRSALHELSLTSGILWETTLGGTIQNSTITYAVNGKQYVAVGGA
jgi:hypothetical protein